MFHSKLLSSFLQIFLAHVVFAVANSSAGLIRLSIANNQNVFLVSGSVLANYEIPGVFRVLYEVSIFASALNLVKKYSNTDLRASVKLYRPTRTAVDYSPLRVRESVPILQHLLRPIPQAWATYALIAHLFLDW